ncbi:VOC family protein [Cryptosporangium minutisporangium]|uniref:VOC family protein n=1 Tax=Cryptosporangium minutisporangium TaxID=113569 RepID=A0ABP6T7P4_9ACTN
MSYPILRQTVLDCEDTRELAEFYRQLLGLEYRPGDEPENGDKDWLVLRNPGGAQLAFQQVEKLPRATWPEGQHPQQLHLDLTVSDPETLTAQRDRALALGAEPLLDRFDDPDEPLYVFADPAGHPFCIFVE